MAGATQERTLLRRLLCVVRRSALERPLGYEKLLPNIAHSLPQVLLENPYIFKTGLIVRPASESLNA